MKKLIGVVIVVGVVVAGLAMRRAGGGADAAGNRLLADRIWIDHVPTSEQDTLQAFIALSEHSVGVFQASSMWRGGYEGFRYEASGADVRIVYPQTGEREAVKAKARKCSEREMDFCLEIEGASRGVKRYYSREGWEIRGGDVDAAARRVDALRAELAARR
jgi:hypothetical protein